MSTKKQKVATSSDVERNHKACLKLLTAMQRNPNCEPFLAPVDWKALELPMYPKVIKKPMDLGTVEKNLQSNKYAAVEEFANDVRLIWSNCQTFNIEGSDFYELAGHLSNDFESKMSAVGNGPLREGAKSTGGGGGSGGKDSGGGGATLSKEHIAQCKAVLKELSKRKDAAIFLEPVPWEELGLTDYPIVIKRPMDLGTVTKRLDAGQYASVQAVRSDIDLIWTNAMKYNVDGSYVFELAAELKTVANQSFQAEPKPTSYKKSSLGATSGEDDTPKQLTFEMRRELHEKASLLTAKELYGMLVVIEDVCKKAANETAPNEIDIDFDSLDLPGFLKVEQYVQDCIAKKKGK